MPRKRKKKKSQEVIKEIVEVITEAPKQENLEIKEIQDKVEKINISILETGIRYIIKTNKFFSEQFDILREVRGTSSDSIKYIVIRDFKSLDYIKEWLSILENKCDDYFKKNIKR